MGCFSAQKDRGPPEELSHPTLRSLLECKQPSLPPTGWIGEKNYSLFAASPSFKAKAKAIQSMSRFLRSQPRALSAPSSLASMRNAGEGDYSQHHPEISLPHSAPLIAGSFSEFGTCWAAQDSRHSGPVSASGAGTDTNGPCIQTNNLLFPLPRPPEDVASQSVSSTGSTALFSSSELSSSTTLTSQSTVASNDPSSSAALRVESSISSVGFVPLPVNSYVCQPMPLPPPPDSGTIPREFSIEELAGACQNFSANSWIRDGGAGSVYRAIVQDHSNEITTLEVAVTRLVGHGWHSFKKWRAEVNSLARLANPHLCKVIGFSAEDNSSIEQKSVMLQRERLLVYESPPNGSLDSLLYGRMDGAPLDWSTRMRIALGAAQGLGYLHERTPKRIIYSCFKALNIQVDESFNAKLSDFGFATRSSTKPLVDNLQADDPYLAPEILTSNSCSTTKSNVWSFGVVLLELLTGRQHMDEMFPDEERNLFQWAKPYMVDAKRLYLVMDPELKGRYPTKSAKVVADLAMQCIEEDPSQRPSMREAVDTLRTVQNSRFSNPGLSIYPFTRKSRSLNSAQQWSPGRLSQLETHKLYISGEITTGTPFSPVGAVLSSPSPSCSSAATVSCK